MLEARSALKPSAVSATHPHGPAEPAAPCLQSCTNAMIYAVRRP